MRPALKHFVDSQKHVIILLDNAPGHKMDELEKVMTEEEKLFIHFKFLPPNMSPAL